MGLQRFFFLLFILGLSYLCISCYPVYFSQPQPIDAENKYHFPNSLRGKFTFEDGFAVVKKRSYVEFEEYAYSILICKDSTLFKKIDQASFPNPQGSLKVRAGSLSFHKIGTESFELSENKFLRKVSREIYVLNRKDSIIWQVNPIIIGPLKKIDVLYLSDDNVHNSYLQYLGKFIFLDVGFTKEELLQRINEGLFDNYYRTYHRSKKRYTTYSVFVKNKEVSKGEVNDEME